MSKTRIEWTDETWNPVTGCTPISPGCAHCYARRMAKRLAGRVGYPAAPHEFDVTLHPDKLSEPLTWRKPRRVFVCSMSDLFHKDVPLDFIWCVYDSVRTNPHHVFQILTKRPERALEFYRWLYGDSDVPKNVWFGVTAENNAMWAKRRDAFLATPAAVHFVSIEPALECLYFSGRDISRLDWVICGGETGPNARPMDLDWARALRDQCVAAGVPFFYKGAGTATLPKSDPEYMRLDGAEWKQFPQ